MLSEQERIKHEMAAADHIRAGFKRFGHEAGGQARIESTRAVSEARDQVVMGGWFGKGHLHGSAPDEYSSVYGMPAKTEMAGPGSVYGQAPANDGGSIHRSEPAASSGNASVYGTSSTATDTGSIHGNGPAADTQKAGLYGTVPVGSDTGSIHGSGPAASSGNASVYGTASAAQPQSTTHGPPEKKGPEAGLGR